MTWRYAKDGHEMGRPSADGIHIDGPLTVDDMEKVLIDLVCEIVEQAKREAREEVQK